MNSASPKPRLIALLGQRDHPTDGVEDYCCCLSESLAGRGICLDLIHVPFVDQGWFRALRGLWQTSSDWQGCRVLVQYTSLAWSRRGFPLGMLAIVFLLGRRRASITVIFHDASPYAGSRLIDRARRAVQTFVMRRLSAVADHVILPVNPAHLFWLASRKENASYIPVGSNIPAPPQNSPPPASAAAAPRSKLLSVFGITPGPSGQRQMADIRILVDAAMQCGSPVHLRVFGRETAETEPELRRLLAGSGVELTVLGQLPAPEIGTLLAASDLLIDVRAPLSGRRGSAIAGIVCGTPVVGFESPETDEAIRSAGVVLAACGDIQPLAEATARILTDGKFRDELRKRNRAATAKFFSWDVISNRILRVVGCEDRLSPAQFGAERKEKLG